MPTLAAWTEQFIDHGRYLRGWSPKTVCTYRQSLATLHAADVGPLSRASLQAFVLSMRLGGHPKPAINRHFKTGN